MKTSYDYYLMGCREAGVPPVSAWRFNLAYTKYRRHVGREFEDLLAHDVKKRQRVLARWQRLHGLADLVRRGQDIADRARRYGVDEDEPGAAGAGVREPLPPRVPVLAGCAARPLPSDDSLSNMPSWRA